MGRKRTLFTQRELNKLSKTHKGRLKIFRGYGLIAVFYFVCSLALGIFGTTIKQSMMTSLGFIGTFISAIVALVFFVLFKNEKQDEKERLIKAQNEQEQREFEEHKRKEYQKMLAQIETEKQQQKLLQFKNSNMDEIDKMSGYQFETFIAEILSDLGFKAITTKKSGDFGADIIVEKDNNKIIIQTKRFSKKVSISAVQEISSAKAYYDIDTAWVITNNYFTDPAICLAQANNVHLIDREALSLLILQAKNVRNNKQIA